MTATSTPNAPKPAPTPIELAGRKIRSAWVAGLVSSVVTLGLVLLAMSGTNPAGLDGWAFVDVAINLALCFGVYRKSRTCAVLLLAFFVANKLLMWTATATFTGLPMALVFVWFFGQGVVGTFQHHRLTRAAAA